MTRETVEKEKTVGWAGKDKKKHWQPLYLRGDPHYHLYTANI